MPFNLTKKYNDLLDLLGMSEYERTKSLRAIFNRDIQDNPHFSFNGKSIYPTVQPPYKKGNGQGRASSGI